MNQNVLLCISYSVILENIRKNIIQRTGLAVMFWTRFWKVLVSNLDRHAITFYCGFCGLHQSLQADSGIVLSLEHDRYFPNPFQFINRSSYYHPMLCNVAAHKIAK
jgi:hypothetical protein